MAAIPGRTRVYLDLTHLGRHVTGIERVSIEQFERVNFESADIVPIRSKGVVSMILRQQFLLPLYALLNPRAIFVFPGFPPSPFFVLIRDRVLHYVHDTFLITRKADLSFKARIYMAPQFSFAVRRLKHFLVNSQKTKRDLEPFAAGDATIGLYRPGVRNVFGLSGKRRTNNRPDDQALRLVSLGTVEPRKNYSAAVAILDALRASSHPDAELHIIGRTGWGENADKIATHPGVTVHGYLAVEGVRSIVESADVYLCTSHDEGLGLPLLEAQYSGLPVVAPDQPVFREVLGHSGTFVDPTVPSAAAATISNLVAKPNWRDDAATTSLANVERWNTIASADLASAKGLFQAGLDHVSGVPISAAETL